MEIYIQPFWGAVAAGVGSVMCSYNRINDVYACENDETLNVLLKGKSGESNSEKESVGCSVESHVFTEYPGYLGFEGFVMSDWGATHSTVDAANNGLDQQMPDNAYFGSALMNAVAAGVCALCYNVCIIYFNFCYEL